MSLLHKLNRSLQQKGVITTIRVCFRSIPEPLPRKAEFDPWDAKHNVETTSRMGLGGLTIRGDSSDSNMYAPIAWDVLEDAIEAIPSKDATFIDYGSGKGRALFVASHFPFREIIGVEFAEELHDIACRNIASYRSDWNVLADAREFQPPRRDLVACFTTPSAGRSSSRHSKDFPIILIASISLACALKSRLKENRDFGLRCGVSTSPSTSINNPRRTSGPPRGSVKILKGHPQKVAVGSRESLRHL